MISYEEIISNNERLEQIFLDIVNTYYLQKETDINSTNLQKIIKKLIDIYYKNSHRHLYSSFSEVLLKLNDEQKIALVEYFNNLVIFAFNNYEFASEDIRTQVLTQILKLYDHINLESNRILIQTNIQENLNEIKLKVKETDDLNKKSEALNKKSEDLNIEAQKLYEKSLEGNNKSYELNQTSQKILEKTQNQINEYHSHNVTILGIFSALVITFSGIFSLDLNGLSQLPNYPIWTIGFYLCLSAFFLFDSTFLLLYVIAKLNGKSIAVTQHKSTTKPILRLWYKYPYVVIFNLILIGLIIMFYLTTVLKS